MSCIRPLTGHGDVVNAVLIGPDGRTGRSGSLDRTLQLWDLERGLEVQERHRQPQSPGIPDSREVLALSARFALDQCRALDT